MISFLKFISQFNHFDHFKNIESSSSDHIPQIWDGKNVMDFVDEEIDEKLNQLLGLEKER